MSKTQKKLLSTVGKISKTKTDSKSYVEGAMYVNNIYTSTLIKMFGRKTGLAISNSIIEDFHKEIKGVKAIKLRRKN